MEVHKRHKINKIPCDLSTCTISLFFSLISSSLLITTAASGSLEKPMRSDPIWAWPGEKCFL